MQRVLFTSLCPLIIVVSSVCAHGQASQPPAPIECTIKDNEEDAACRSRLKGLFTRSGDRLTLKLGDGKSKVYVGDRDACDEGDGTDKCVIYFLLRFYPQVPSFLIAKSYYECGEYHFISQRTGSTVVLSAIPELSPNAKYLISIDTSDACDRKYDIAIWSTQTDPPTLEFRYQAKQYENWEIKGWDSDSRIKLQAFVNGRQGPYDQYAEAVRQESGWRLVLEKRVDRPRQPPPIAQPATPIWPAPNAAQGVSVPK
jgi:hypothetical protein